MADRLLKKLSKNNILLLNKERSEEYGNSSKLW